MLELGSDEIRRQFRITDELTLANNGSFGRIPNVVLEKRIQLLHEQANNPGLLFRETCFNHYAESVKAAAEFVGAEPDDLCIVDNVTTGMNAVLRSLKFDPGSEILLTTHTYLSVRNTAGEVEKFHGLKRRLIQLPIPLSSEEHIVDLYEKHLQENPNIKIVIIDHITSPSAIKMPVVSLVKLCRKYNVISIIDGAHAPGQVEVDVKNIGSDFYMGTFYKWTFATLACGFLWVSPKYKGKIRSAISYYPGDVHLHQQFGYVGARDYTPLYTVPVALDFYNKIGGLKTITDYNSSLVEWAQGMLCEALGTSPLDIPSTMRAPCMAVLSVPPPPPRIKNLDHDDMTLFMLKQYSVLVVFTEINGKIWLRPAANVYNVKEDYLKLRDALIAVYEIDKQ